MVPRPGHVQALVGKMIQAGEAARLVWPGFPFLASLEPTRPRPASILARKQEVAKIHAISLSMGGAGNGQTEQVRRAHRARWLAPPSDERPSSPVRRSPQRLVDAVTARRRRSPSSRPPCRPRWWARRQRCHRRCHRRGWHGCRRRCRQAAASLSRATDVASVPSTVGRGRTRRGARSARRVAESGSMPRPPAVGPGRRQAYGHRHNGLELRRLPLQFLLNVE